MPRNFATDCNRSAAIGWGTISAADRPGGADGTRVETDEVKSRPRALPNLRGPACWRLEHDRNAATSASRTHKPRLQPRQREVRARSRSGRRRNAISVHFRFRPIFANLIDDASLVGLDWKSETLTVIKKLLTVTVIAIGVAAAPVVSAYAWYHHYHHHYYH